MLGEVMEKDKRKLEAVAELFKVFADYSRIRIINALSGRELCVSELVEILDMSQSSISHQLKILRHSKLVKTRREGKNVFYSLDDEHVECIFNDGLDHVNHGDDYEN